MTESITITESSLKDLLYDAYTRGLADKGNLSFFTWRSRIVNKFKSKSIQPEKPTTPKVSLATVKGGLI